MSSKTRTKRKPSKLIMGQFLAVSKRKKKAPKKKRVSTSSKRRKGRVKQVWPVVVPNRIPDSQVTQSSAKAEKSELTSDLAFPKAAAVQRHITACTPICILSAGLPLTDSGSLPLPEPGTAVPMPPIFVKSPVGQIYRPQSDTYSQNERKSFARIWISAAVIAFILSVAARSLS